MSIATDIQTGLQKLTDEQYHSLPFASKHALDVIRESSPGHLDWQRRNPSEPSEAMRFGSALHTFVLERHEFDTRHPIASQCCATLKSGKRAGEHCSNDASYQLNGGTYCGTHRPDGATLIENTISRDDAARIRAMADAIAAHPAASAVLAINDEMDLNEPAVIVDRVVGDYTVRCKAKLDAIRIKNWSAIIDIKTCQSAALDTFQRDVDSYGYYRQAAYYFDMLDAVGIHADSFVLVAVEKSAPFAVATYAIGRDSISVQIGREENDRLLRIYANCERTGHWPLYDDAFKQIELSPAAIRRALQKD